ncbi:hypothetical protein GUITHDRAFT_99710 [Guillardia theta CCMP2712]|uniref:Uncharacterized protein n=1 Tax=Guillardia theta (strain CCMP2712) TaxID=905079 RepID=L1K3N2_GUITC|nr:hypothetical protein GUITHDRAFT_99710 [Guillardia theta CCMP2712]EKX55075.1 hypothetical protein GUITHDRAFT_99710 [Guillardia theta CCMP2712]|eukprot:XP_005842055.1 hypothetical protein GUITHDRAFT_99710 [Guillardia theta CCMP2712]
MPKRGRQDGGDDEQSARKSKRVQQNKEEEIRKKEEELRKKEEELRKKEEELRKKEEELRNDKTKAMLKRHVDGENKEYWEDVLKDLADQEKKLEKEREELRKEKKEEELRKKEEELRNDKTKAMLKRHVDGENKEYWEDVLKDLADQEKKLEKEREELRKGWKGLPERENHIAWKEITRNRDAGGYMEERKFFCLDGTFWDQKSSGQERQRVLYCRECFKEQWDFIKERVCEAGCLGWILGPPGTGKSTTTMSFIQSLSMEEGWMVMCVRLWKWSSVQVLQVDGGVLRIAELPRNGAEDMLRRVLREWSRSKKKYLVSLDGYQESSPLVDDSDNPPLPPPAFTIPSPPI